MSDEHTEKQKSRENPFSRRSEFRKFRKPVQKRGIREMTKMTTEDLEKVYDRLRETEAQTREQGVRIDALVSRLDSSTATNQSYISIIQQMMAKSEKREEWFWRAIMFLLATVMALALGPKMADKIVSMGVSTVDIAPWHNDRENWNFI